MRKILILLLLWFCASASCFVDGSNIAVTNITPSVHTRPIVLTTSQPNDVVVLQVVANGEDLSRGGGTIAVTGITGGGLTWAKRFQQNAGQPGCYTFGICYPDVETWWAVAASPLAAQSFDVTFTNGNSFLNMVIFGVAGLSNPSSPWDSNGSLPASAVNSGGAATPMQVSGVSTSNADDFLFYTCFANIVTGGVVGSNCSWPNPPGKLQPWVSVGAGYQQVLFDNFFDNSATWALSVSSPFVSATLSAQDPTVAIQTHWIVMADALKCSTPLPPPGGAIPHIWVHE